MTDKFTTKKRSEIMSHIHGKDTKPEIKLRSALFRQGYRFRKNDKRLPGTPDIHLPKYKTVIFVHGCFWHAHDNCKHFKLPKSNSEFWATKFSNNKARDFKNELALNHLGYTVITIWECEINKDINECLVRIKNKLN